MKVTLLLPDDLVEELRGRSLAEGRSLDATVAEALRRGLHRSPVRETAAERPGIVAGATKRFDPGALDRALAPFGERLRGLDAALDWPREEREL